MEPTAKDIAAQLRKPTGQLGRQVAEKMNESNRPMTSFTYDHLEVKPSDHVLEIGFGNGRLMPLLLDQHEVKMTGIDLSAEMVAWAKENNADYLNRGSLRLMEGSVSALPFDDESFDSACSVNTFYFWEDALKCAKEILRVLRPGGCLCLGVTPKEEMKQLPPTQFGFNLYEDEEIISILNQAGFQTIEKHKRMEAPVEIGGQSFQFHSMVIKGFKS
ncbi:class I SAM-dependent methyltransferase [Reichenbachiella ulvae]|uniref:Class I SAM-dependent methyltransferase n=1 Tax=Reichenbachiella ulvae TaxID=2980104 RepID=A0ABT3CR53_9BACT|nr:class I SAM-dependent methyltransferase [Reichenbachiella ulvae]MCV9386117.1 class I SAM-dependent methyltransferase [Reichenbachiella ulvae]